MKRKHILVTGGAGYIGSHTVVALLENGYQPVIVDDLRNAEAAVLGRLESICGEKIPFHQVDCCDKTALRAVFEQYTFEGAIHFAAYKAVGESVENPLAYYHNNLLSLLNLLALAQERGLENIIFSSSCTVYGEPKGSEVVDESCPLAKAFSPYGQTKIICEQILADYFAANANTKVVCLRYFNPVGAHDSALIGELPLGRPNNLLPFITQTAAGKWPQLTIFGKDYPTNDGTCVRDYIHVMDLAEAHVAALHFALEQKAKRFEAINIGTGKGSSVLELVQLFEAVSGEKLPYVFGERRNGDVSAIYANADKAKKLLHWSAQRSLETSVASAWRWEKNLMTHVK